MERKKYCSKTELGKTINAGRFGPKQFDYALSTLAGCGSLAIEPPSKNGNGRPSTYIRYIRPPEF